MSVSYGPLVAVRDASLDVSRGQIAVLMGRNGSGKSSLLWALTGVGPRRSGRCTVDDVEVTRLPTAQVLRHIRLVPQSASDLLFLDSVDAECAAADTQTGRPPGTCRALLDRIVSGLPGDRHPRDLSEGQRLGLVLAVQLTADPAVLLLDEPTRGLDYTAKQGLLEILRAGAADGRTVVIATHDVEFAAEIADRVLVMATGEVIADGPPAEVLGNSRSLAPQVARVFAPEHWLTVEQVRRALTDGPDVPAAADRDDPAVAR
jgi:energy-coupling factor transport system ATP-binding protein